MDVDFVRDCFEKQDENFEAACDEMIERRDQLESAQLKTTDELETLRKDLERIEQKQDESSKESTKIGIATLILTALGLAATIVFGMLQYLN